MSGSGSAAAGVDDQAGGRGRPSPGRLVLLAALLVLATSVPYLPLLGAGFVNWDDPVYVLGNPLIRSLDGRGLAAIGTSFLEGNYHPLTLLSYAVEYRLFGLDPRPYHLTNLALHLANVLLVFLLTRRLFGGVALAAGVGLAFGLHPMRVEAVAWVSERKELLSALGYFASLLLYLRAGDPRQRRQTLLLGASFACFVLACLSKAMAVTLPAALFVLDRMQPGRRPPAGAAAKVPFLAAGIFFAGLALWAQQSAQAVTDSVLAVYGWKYAILLLHNLWFYLEKTVLPLGLSAFYPYPPASALTDPAYLAGAASGLAVLGFLLWRGGGARWGAVFFLVAAAPVLRLIPVGNTPVADRYLYLPGLGLIWAAAALLERVELPRARRALAAAAAVVFLLFGWWSWQRAGIWTGSVPLWSDVVARHPSDFLARFNLGSGLLAERNDPAAALRQFEAALALRPDRLEAGVRSGDPYLHHYRGLALLRLGRRTEAEEDFLAAVRFKGDWAEPLLEAGTLAAERGDFAAAERLLGRARDLQPGNALVWVNLGEVYRLSGRGRAALASFIKARDLGFGPEIERKIGSLGELPP